MISQTVPTQVYLTIEQKEFLVELAKLEIRTMSSVVREALELYFDKRVGGEYGNS